MPPADLINSSQPTPAARDGARDAAWRGDTLPPFVGPMTPGIAVTATAPGSWGSPCECPGDCLRDHQLD
jgi:hypothetical protein